MKYAYLVGIVLSILLGSFFNWILCCEISDTTGVEEDNGTLTEKVATGNNPFIISDNTGDFEYQSDNNFNFDISNFIIKRPVSPEIDQGVTSLKSYIGNQNNKFVDITGYYDPAEENKSAFPNLGLARANAVKNYLLSLGVSSKKLNIHGAVKGGLLSTKDSIIEGPVSVAITENANIKDAQAVVDAIKQNPIVLHFDSGKSTIQLTQEQREKYLDIVRALDKVDHVSILVEGHTDNTGTPEGNLVLGKKRASFIKDYLVTNGVTPIRIQTVSKGQDEPIAENETEQGRSQNRRIVITVN
ncbi:OmpA family protein [Galbibacter sp.]|uniref:OmpA family protein n=1 Tax=Galbibacter sp. TaxID=2918471 RepID=UPI003A90A737